MKKKRHHTIIYYTIVWTLLVLFTFTTTTLITLQTFWGRQKVKAAFIEYAKENNINLKIESVEGLIPFEYKFKNVSVFLENEEIHIKTLDCKINVFSFLKNKLNFKTFNANHISYNVNQSKESPKSEVTWPYSPIAVKFENLKLENLEIKTKDRNILFNVTGKANIEKDGNLITANLDIKRKGFHNSYLDLYFIGRKESRLIDLKSSLYIDSLNAIDFLVNSDTFDASFDFHFNTLGTLDTYLGFLDKTEKKYPIANGNVFGNIYKIQTKNKPYNFVYDIPSHFSFNFSTLEDLKINIPDGLINNPIYNANLDAIISKDFTFDKSNLTIKIDDLSKIDFKPLFIFGSFNLQASYENKKLNSTYTLTNFRINDVPFNDFNGSLSGQIENKILNGTLISNFFAVEQSFNISTDYKFENYFLNFSNFKMDSPSSKINANLTITPAFSILGDGKIHFEDLKQIQIFYPSLVYYGPTDIDFNFKQKIENEKTIPNLVLKITSNDFHLKIFEGKSLNLLMNIDYPLTNPNFDLDLKINDLKFQELTINTLNFTTSTKEENWPYLINIVGKLKQPFNFDSNGFWKAKNNEFTANIQDITGNLFNHNFITPKPIKLEITDKNFILTELSLELADSSIYADIDLSKKESKAKIDLKHIPLDFLSLNPLDLDVSGFATLAIKLKGFANDIDSKLDLDLEELNILTLGEKAPLQANGKLKAEIKNDYFDLNGYLNVQEKQLLSLKGKIPIDIDIVKLSFKPNQSKPINLAFKYDGKVEEILDFIDIGSQHLDGDLSAQMELFNKLEQLRIKGFFTFKNGFYENYYTGTIIKDIEASIKASDEKIHLEYLKGKDLEKGTLCADGEFSLSKKKNFPFYFKTQIKDLLCVDTEVFKGIATANFEITGDRTSSIAKGNVQIDKLDMSIPDKLPITIPDLKPKFIYHAYQKEEKKEEEKIMYPFYLDLNINASKTPITVNGQGLISSWKGSFKIGGSYMNVETRGGLELLKGEYSFSGKKFTLSKGRVIFSGTPNEMPLLDIQAKMNQQGVDLFANLRGPIDAPKIFFTSDPPLSASSILALLIFGQPLSDLSPNQTLELSYTMSSQEAPSALTKSDSISTLGIDRYKVIQPTPSNPYGTDQMAIQLGNYISKGLVISYYKGEGQGNHDVVVEIDLKKGFILQAEAQEEKEQGKFTLKYRKNY